MTTVRTPWQAVSGASGNVLLQNQFFPVVGAPGTFWPQPFTLLVPANTAIQFVFVLHHGAGGTIANYGQQMNLWALATGPTLSTVNWAFLQRLKCAVIVIQGSYCQANINGGTFNPNNVTAVAAQGPLRPQQPVTTWCDGAQYSGANDCGAASLNAPLNGPGGMIGDVPAYIISRFGTAVYRCCAGHSNGGMWTSQNYIAQNGSPAANIGFHAFFGSSAPTVRLYDGQFPAGTVGIRSTMYGDSDPLLGILGGHFNDPYITGTERARCDVSYIPGTTDWPFTQWVGPFARFAQECNAWAANHGKALPNMQFNQGVTTIVATGAPAAYGTPGSWTIWTDPYNANELVNIIGCDHSTRMMQKIMATAPPPVSATLLGRWVGVALRYLATP